MTFLNHSVSALAGGKTQGKDTNIPLIRYLIDKTHRMKKPSGMFAMPPDECEVLDRHKSAR